jgi:hypothetical protein
MSDKLTELFDRLENTAQKSQMKSPSKVHTPMLDRILAAKPAAKPGVNVTSSTTAPAAVPSTAPTESENRIAAAVLQMLQKSIPAPATGLHGLLEKARAKHTAELDAKIAKQAKGIPVPQNSHLKGMARLLANSKGDSSKSSTVANSPLRI